MAFKNDDDFWKQNNEDFWNKSVMPTDWLSEGKDVVTEQEAEEIPEQNPYIYEEEQATQAVQTTQAVEATQTVQTQQAKSIINEIEPTVNKKASGHLIVRLLIVGVTFIYLLSLVTKHYTNKLEIERLLVNIDIIEEVAEDSFLMKDGGTFVMPEAALTEIEADIMVGLPVGEKMVSINIEYQAPEDGQYNTERETKLYISYEEPEGTVFKSNLRAENIYPFSRMLEVPEEFVLDEYSINGYRDQEGYYFFFIPDEVSEITVYVQEQNRKSGIWVTNSVHKKDIEIFNTHQLDLESLREEEE